MATVDFKLKLDGTQPKKEVADLSKMLKSMGKDAKQWGKMLGDTQFAKYTNFAGAVAGGNFGAGAAIAGVNALVNAIEKLSEAFANQKEIVESLALEMQVGKEDAEKLINTVLKARGQTPIDTKINEKLKNAGSAVKQAAWVEAVPNPIARYYMQKGYKWYSDTTGENPKKAKEDLVALGADLMKVRDKIKDDIKGEMPETKALASLGFSRAEISDPRLSQGDIVKAFIKRATGLNRAGLIHTMGSLGLSDKVVNSSIGYLTGKENGLEGNEGSDLNVARENAEYNHKLIEDKKKILDADKSDAEKLYEALQLKLKLSDELDKNKNDVIMKLQLERDLEANGLKILEYQQKLNKELEKEQKALEDINDKNEFNTKSKEAQITALEDKKASLEDELSKIPEWDSVERIKKEQEIAKTQGDIEKALMDRGKVEWDLSKKAEQTVGQFGSQLINDRSGDKWAKVGAFGGLSDSAVVSLTKETNGLLKMIYNIQLAQYNRDTFGADKFEFSPR